jgi:type VI secretion system protein ImpK
MQSITTTTPPASSRPRRARSNNDLTSLSAPVFESVLKLRAGILLPSAELRPSFERMLEEVEQRAATQRRGAAQVQAVKFALAAFVDEMVLSESFPLHEKWENNPLQLKYFGEHLAGVKFFDRLDEMMAQAELDADVVEVYYLCLILGFKGQYKVYLESQLKGVIERVAERLRVAGRLRDGALSPHWQASDQPAPARDYSRALWIGGGGAVAGLLLLYALLSLSLGGSLHAAQEQLLR